MVSGTISDYEDLAEWLMDQGIQSVSLNPDTVVDTWIKLATNELGQSPLQSFEASEAKAAYAHLNPARIWGRG